MQEILKTIKYKGHYYTKGNLLKIEDKDKAEFIRKEIILEEGKKTDSKKALNTNLNKDAIDLPIKDETQPINDKEEPLNSFNDYTVAELKIMLDNQGFEYENRATKQELIDLLEQV